VNDHIFDGRDDPLMDAYYRCIGEAHVENIIDKLDKEKDAIEKIVLPESMNKWFKDFAADQKKKEKKIKRAAKLKRIYSVAAAAALIVFVSMTIVTLTVDAVKARVIEMFMKTYEKYTEIRIDIDRDEDSDIKSDIDLDEYYYPSYLPKGFKYDDFEGSSSGCFIIFTKKGDDEKDTLVFQQTNSESNYRIDTENAIVVTMNINGSEGTLVEKGDRIVLIWHDGGTALIISGSVKRDEIIKMAESVEKIKR
jgi:hypothetical protein